MFRVNLFSLFVTVLLIGCAASKPSSISGPSTLQIGTSSGGGDVVFPLLGKISRLSSNPNANPLQCYLYRYSWETVFEGHINSARLQYTNAIPNDTKMLDTVAIVANALQSTGSRADDDSDSEGYYLYILDPNLPEPQNVRVALSVNGITQQNELRFAIQKLIELIEVNCAISGE